MSPIPPKLRAEMSADPYYLKCARQNEDCRGHITWEHSWIYRNRQIQEKWAIIPLCWRHHLGDKFYKKLNQLIALNRATPEDLAKYPNRDWVKERRRLEYDLKTLTSPTP